MSLRKDYLAERLHDCFWETIACETESWGDAFEFNPMLFLVNKDWDLFGGPMDEVLDIELLFKLGRVFVNMVEDGEYEKGLLPYVCAAVSGAAQKEDGSEGPIKSRMMVIHSDEFTQSVIEFSDGRDVYVTNEIPDNILDVEMRNILSYIKERNV